MSESKRSRRQQPAAATSGTFNVTFEGLVMFVGPNEGTKTHVVLIDDHHHNAELSLPSGDIPLQKGDVVTFSIGEGIATTSRSYQRVPRLSKYVRGDIHGDVKDKKGKHLSVLATIILPDGSLTAEGTFDHPAKLITPDGDEEIVCMARWVRLTTSATGDVGVTVENTNRPQPAHGTVRAGGTLDVLNTVDEEEEEEDHPGEKRPHFNLFAKLVAPGSTFGSGAEYDSQICVNDRPHNPGSEPKTGEASPNGDCGPTSWP